MMEALSRKQHEDDEEQIPNIDANNLKEEAACF